jgi:hypothetical protein
VHNNIDITCQPETKKKARCGVVLYSVFVVAGQFANELRDDNISIMEGAGG